MLNLPSHILLIAEKLVNAVVESDWHKSMTATATKEEESSIVHF
jgi:hypothetical protein